MPKYEIEADSARVSLSSDDVDYVDLVVPLFKKATVQKVDDSDVAYCADIWDVIRISADSWWILDFCKYAAVAGGIVIAGFLKEIGKDSYTGFKSMMKGVINRHKEQSKRTDASGLGGVCLRFVQEEKNKRQYLKFDLYSQESEDENAFDEMFEALEKEISPIVLAALSRYGSEVPYTFIAQMGRRSIPIMILEIGPIEITSIKFPVAGQPLVEKPSPELTALIHDAMRGLNLAPR